MSVGEDSVTFTNIAASTSPFVIKGGRYLVGVKASNYGTVKLQQLAADATTYLDLKQAFEKSSDDSEEDLVIGTFAADGAKILDLSPGEYRLTVSSATAIYATITRVPLA